MILFADNKGKIIALIILVAFFMGLIFYQWAKFSPWERSPDKISLAIWPEIKSQVSTSFISIKEDFSFAGLQFNDLKQEFERQVKQDILLEETREYINNHSRSSVE